ncbi:MAG: transglycosylase SLT domain-containing protein [Succinivibrionaceae bacterium]|nr:transglycosylase SLT domain-containing protein [Succinivibrionaceae bacterium]
MTAQVAEAEEVAGGSLWHSDLYNDARFTLNIRLSEGERREARQLARSFSSHLNDGRFFMHHLLSELKAHNLPIELAVIPLLESGFNMRARSPNGALGAWQFIRSTGRIYGLERNASYDEFYDFIESTKASMKYFTKLYKDCAQNWELAVAAYNQGEYGVMRQIRAARARGATKLTPATVPLSRGARAYIKRFRVFAELLRHPGRYGVTLPEVNNRPAFKRVQVAGRLNSMRKAAQLSGVQIGLLKHLNAGFLSDSLRTNKNRPLLVPVESAPKLEEAIGLAASMPHESDGPKEASN